MLNRRNFLLAAGAATGARPRQTGVPRRPAGAGAGSASAASRTRSIYDELGVKPFINAAGTYTALSACVMPLEVARAMEEASRLHVSIAELQQAVSQKIAALLGCEAALVTAGCAAAMTLATAACIAGKDTERIRRLPDTTGMKNEVILQKTHRVAYDHAIRAAGARLVEVETREELERAVSERTAMLFFLNNADPLGKIRREEFAQTANRLRVPALIDAAADLPPAENLRAFTGMGFDLAAFSGGKGLRGPQCSGLLLGKKELIEAAFLNGPPHSDSVGRGTKVGKEEIVGVYRALDLYLKRNHAADWAEWERRVAVIRRELARVPGLEATPFVPEIANHSPHLNLQWDRRKISLTIRDVVEQLGSGEPRIALRPNAEQSTAGVDISVWMMQPGQERHVARRLREIFSGGNRG